MGNGFDCLFQIDEWFGCGWVSGKYLISTYAISGWTLIKTIKIDPRLPRDAKVSYQEIDLHAIRNYSKQWNWIELDVIIVLRQQRLNLYLIYTTITNIMDYSLGLIYQSFIIHDMTSSLKPFFIRGNIKQFFFKKNHPQDVLLYVWENTEVSARHETCRNWLENMFGENCIKVPVKSYYSVNWILFGKDFRRITLCMRGARARERLIKKSFDHGFTGWLVFKSW